MNDPRLVDWSNPDEPISKYFTVREAIYLSRWGRLAREDDGLSGRVKFCLIAMAAKMDVVRDFIGLPIIVHRWYSPPGYNAVVGGSRYSRHMSLFGEHSAVDWHGKVDGAATQSEQCDILRAALEPKLEEWGLRMERLPGAHWVHLDDALVMRERYFRP